MMMIMMNITIMWHRSAIFTKRSPLHIKVCVFNEKGELGEDLVLTKVELELPTHRHLYY